MRLCANAGAILHLIHPLGFSLTDKQLRRAGMDYRRQVDFFEYDDFNAFQKKFPDMRIFACSTKGTCCYTEPVFQHGDAFLFGAETRGLPEDILNNFPKKRVLRIPMLPESRSLNLSNSAAIILYEAWRQHDFLRLKSPISN